jgi:hypothetical protein
MGLPEL